MVIPSAQMSVIVEWITSPLGTTSSGAQYCAVPFGVAVSSQSSDSPQRGENNPSRIGRRTK